MANASRKPKPITRKVTIDRADFDASLEAVLEEVKFRNENGRRLDAWETGQAEVTLTFRPLQE